MADRDKLLGVQYLRAAAAMMIAYFHLVGQIPKYSRYLAIHHLIDTAHLSAGVPIFFVISGFIMYLTGIDSAPLQFAKRRVFRIVPLYWALTLTVCVLAAIAPHLLRDTDCSMRYLMKSLLFIPYHNPAHPNAVPPEPILVPGWSLNYEMAFYVLFALALFLPSRHRMPAICCTLAALCATGFMVRSQTDSVSGFYFSPLLLLFAAGLMVAWLYRKGTLRNLRPWMCWTLIAGGFAALLAAWNIGTGGSFLASLSIVLGVCALDFQRAMPRIPLFALLGDASYSIYLTHLFAFGISREIWQRAGADGAFAAWSFATVSMCAVPCIALISYWLIERPSLAVLSGLFGRTTMMEAQKSRVQHATTERAAG